jgi:hypothetical protein
VEPAGNHEVDHEKQVRGTWGVGRGGQLDHDPLSEALYSHAPRPTDQVQRRIDTAQEERIQDLNVEERRTNDATLQRFDVDRDVG